MLGEVNGRRLWLGIGFGRGAAVDDSVEARLWWMTLSCRRNENVNENQPQFRAGGAPAFLLTPINTLPGRDPNPS
jgi:hypothetical protein